MSGQWLRIAYRNVTRQGKRSALLGGAIAFGFLIVTLLNGFSGGLLKTVEANLATILGGHVYVSGTIVSDSGREIAFVGNPDILDTALTAIGDEVLSVNTRSSALTSLIFNARERTQLIFGLDPIAERSVLESLSFTRGSLESFLADEESVILPQETLERLGLEVGERVIVRASTVDGQANVAELTVSGTVAGDSGLGVIGGYAHRPTLNRLLALAPDEYQQLNLYLRDVTRLEAITTRLHSELERLGTVVPREDQAFGPPGFAFGGPSTVAETERWQGTRFTVTNLNDTLDGISTLVNLINTVALVVFVIILLIITVGVMNSYRLVMLERIGEIGSMRAMGAQRGGVRSIFFWEAALIGLSGAVAGLLVALALMGVLSLVPLPGAAGSPLVLFLDENRLQFVAPISRILFNTFLITLMSILAVAVPAQAAAHLKPAEALRSS